MARTGHRRTRAAPTLIAAPAGSARASRREPRHRGAARPIATWLYMLAPNGMLLDLLEERFRALRFARSVRPAPLHGETLTAGDRSNICLGTIRTCWTTSNETR